MDFHNLALFQFRFNSAISFIPIGLSHEFVMRSILAFSASHLAWTRCEQGALRLAYHHRGFALKGLHEAINAFSKSNCDAVAPGFSRDR